MTELNFHPLANLFPLMQGQEFDDLVKDIKQNGLREPIWLHEGQILDGRNRYRALQACGENGTCRTYKGDDPVGFVISLNLHRRHLNESQRAMVAAKLANMGKGRPAENAPIGAISQTDAGDMLNVGRRNVQRAEVVQRDGAESLQEAVTDGRVAVSTAADVASLPVDMQEQIVAQGESEILAAAKDIRQRKAEERRAENAKLKAQSVPIPEGKYSVIVLDPPWHMEKIERDVAPDQVSFDYPTMTEEELAAFDVSKMAADNCHLFCWTTQKHLPMGLRLLDAWGFRYVLTMVWHKNGGFQPFGLPQYNCEFVLYARKGSPEFSDLKAFNCCFQADRREHSRKPEWFYSLLKRVTDGPRIDVFSRERHDGFAQFGNETEKFIVESV